VSVAVLVLVLDRTNAEGAGRATPLVVLHGGGETDTGGSESPGEISGEGSWPMLRHDAAGNGHAPDRSGPDAAPGQAWSYDELSSDRAMVPVVLDGTVYTQTSSAQCAAIDLVSGEERWRRDLDQSFWHRTPFGPAVTEDALFVGEDDVFALDPEDGETIWTAPDVSPRERLVHDDGVVYACRDEGLQALDAGSGDELWFGETTDNARFVSVGSDDRAYTLDWDTVVRGFDTGNGDQLWQHDLEGNVQSGLTALGDSVYVVDGEELEVLSLSAADGEVEWRTDVNCEFHPTATEEAVYVYNLSGMNVLDPETGSERSDWEGVPVDDSPWGGPSITGEGGFVVAGPLNDGDLSLYGFDADTGGIRWSQTLSAERCGQVAVLEDAVVYATRERVVALA